jgi:hypothetical protein
LASIEAATPDDKTWVVEAGRPNILATPIVEAAPATVGGSILTRIATSPGGRPPGIDGKSVTGLFRVRTLNGAKFAVKEDWMKGRAVSEFR